jgi:hypothetical protein
MTPRPPLRLTDDATRSNPRTRTGDVGSALGLVGYRPERPVALMRRARFCGQGQGGRGTQTTQRVRARGEDGDDNDANHGGELKRVMEDELKGEAQASASLVRSTTA